MAKNLEGGTGGIGQRPLNPPLHKVEFTPSISCKHLNFLTTFQAKSEKKYLIIECCDELPVCAANTLRHSFIVSR